MGIPDQNLMRKYSNPATRMNGCQNKGQIIGLLRIRLLSGEKPE
tara:strand:- start:196 stop:327 length:132 start_codon:yes stop_codon:yes gene_type:complete